MSQTTQKMALESSEMPEYFHFHFNKCMNAQNNNYNNNIVKNK